MSCKTLAIIVVFFFGYCHVNARVFYVNEPVNSQRESYLNPIYPNEPSEQASRDLDLSFSVGDPSENSDNRDIYVVKKVNNFYSNIFKVRDEQGDLTYYN